MKLILEGYPDTDNATRDDIVQAVRRMCEPIGPTFAILSDGYSQVAGTDDRHIIERIVARKCSGKGSLLVRMPA